MGKILEAFKSYKRIKYLTTKYKKKGVYKSEIMFSTYYTITMDTNIIQGLKLKKDGLVKLHSFINTTDAYCIEALILEWLTGKDYFRPKKDKK